MSNYKRLFLDGYNYVFFTIVTNIRKPILINNIELLRKSFEYSLNKFDYEIFAAVILPDHLHLLLKLKNVEDYPRIIYAIKYYFSVHISVEKEQLSNSKIKKGEKGIWQRRFWDHTIRDEKDLQTHLDYIHYNPIKHKCAVSAKCYEFSSFKKFVKKGLYDCEWCNLGDKNGIECLDFE